jgi:hypothetical protein
MRLAAAFPAATLAEKSAMRGIQCPDLRPFAPGEAKRDNRDQTPELFLGNSLGAAK